VESVVPGYILQIPVYSAATATCHSRFGFGKHLPHVKTGVKYLMFNPPTLLLGLSLCGCGTCDICIRVCVCRANFCQLYLWVWLAVPN
jgi:hypothetical protein